MISVIIPTLNEAENLPRSIAAVRSNKIPSEILVVDGGSDDGTREVAAQLSAELILSPVRQRAAQMNLGAQKAEGDVLLFLHADTIIPPSAIEQIQNSLRDPRVGGGAFARQFDSPSAF